MKILIVDDHALFREGLSLLISQLERSAEIFLVGDVRGATERMQEIAFDLILLDWNLGDISGEEAIKTVQTFNRVSRIVVLSAERDVNIIRKSIDLGASGFIHKDFSPASLISAIKSILEGEIYLPPDAFIKHMHTHKPQAGHGASSAKRLEQIFPELTPRQICVLSFLIKGLSNRSISKELNISEYTVKQHLTLIYRTMGVSNRTQVLYILAQNKVLM